jgi:hypothetical protein
LSVGWRDRPSRFIGGVLQDRSERSLVKHGRAPDISAQDGYAPMTAHPHDVDFIDVRVRRG